MKWTIEDYTKKNGGYLRIFCDGERVADVFPFASGADETKTRELARYMVETLNVRSALGMSMPPAS